MTLSGRAKNAAKSEPRFLSVVGGVVLGVLIIALMISNAPLWAYMRIHQFKVEYPIVTMERSMTFPVTLRYREEVETEQGFLIAQCDRTAERPYEFRYGKPVSFPLRCKDLPPGEYRYRACWFHDLLSYNQIGCRDTPFIIEANVQ